MTASSPQALADAADPPRGSLVQPATAGLLAALVGFASTFTIVLGGFTAVGATPAQAASGLTIVCVVQGLLSIGLSLAWRQPISVVWSTPAAALLLSTGVQPGGYPAAIGAFLAAAGLIVLTGLVRPLSRLVAAIPPGLAAAMLAGVLFEICAAPVRALGAQPSSVLPVVLAWAVALRVVPRFAVPVAVVVAVVLVVVSTRLPPGVFSHAWPTLVVTWPAWTWATAASLVVPLFVVTMASQNVPGLAVLRANGYEPDIGRILVATGLGGAANALGSGGLINLAAITAALCAGPEAGPDPARRYLSTLVSGLAYVLLGLFAGVAAAFIAASPAVLIQAVAGLALMGTLAGALATALARPDERVAVAVTFVTTAAGPSFFGVGASFWGLLAGGALLALGRFRAS